ncbi:MAG: Lrp/AsnC family transcriptional regulator [Verrucomicrobia bacterium]|nr:Lrp/AsnC family transcriptional regulator [Verrucomicrobiota bacterium]
MDHHLIAALREDGWKSNVELARQLKVSEGTVRTRLARLRSEGTLRILAVTDHRKLGLVVPVLFNIQTEVGQAEAVAERLAKFESLELVELVTGGYDVVAVGFYRSNDALAEFLSKRLWKVPGIRKIDTAHVLRIVKLGGRLS